MLANQTGCRKCGVDLSELQGRIGFAVDSRSGRGYSLWCSSWPCCFPCAWHWPCLTLGPPHAGPHRPVWLGCLLPACVSTTHPHHFLSGRSLAAMTGGALVKLQNPQMSPDMRSADTELGAWIGCNPICSQVCFSLIFPACRAVQRSDTNAQRCAKR